MADHDSPHACCGEPAPTPLKGPSCCDEKPASTAPAANSCCVGEPTPRPAPVHSCCSGSGDKVAPPAVAKYFCPMCPGVESDQASDCPKCGMALERNPAWRPGTRVLFTCPMHPDVQQDHPGECPKCGMALELMTPPTADDEDPELREMTRRMWVGAALALPVFLLAMGHLVPGAPHWLMGPTSRWLQFALTTPVVLWAGWPFFGRGARSLRSGHFNMFTLIALGVGAAYLHSAVAMLAPGIFPASVQQGGMVGVYFEASAVIIVLVLVGQVLELRARARTGSAIRSLLDLAPPTAILVEAGSEREVPLAAITAGATLRVRPGGKVPVDGVLLEGHAQLDEAMLTGEPEPVAKARGDTVTGGTINGTGTFLMRAERVGQETVLARIVEMVATAQRSRAPIQALADRVAGWFVPAVLAVAVITFGAWAWLGPEPRLTHALVNAVAVLIIACPCALGLATPMSIMVGVGRGAHSGVLVKDAETLERLEKVDTLVVDKTGTLTEGKPRVVRCEPAAGFDEATVLSLAAAVEQGSEHPLASAVIAAARERGLKLPSATEFQSTTGGGVSARVDGRSVLVGKAAFLSTHRITRLEPIVAAAAPLQEQAHTVIFVAVDGQAAGFLALADPIKPSAAAAVRALHDLGLRVVMLTGDHRASAEPIARQLGVDELIAEVSPGEKQARVHELQQTGARVAMAGDGINDAPALAAADAGIAMGTGTDVAIASAGITLLQGDPRALVRAVKLSRALLRNIRQNLTFAFLYNVLGIPLAAGVLYPFFGWLLSPIVAGAAMSLSSVTVIANALRLRHAKLDA